MSCTKFAKWIVLGLIISLFSLQSCTDDTNDNLTIIDNGGGDRPLEIGTTTKSYPGVDEELWIYFERFENAGNNREMGVDLIEKGVTAELGEVDNNSSGSCSYNSSHTFHHIVIDRGFWKDANVNMKEIILFHELGHCYLQRDHNEGSFNDGSCKSIMRSGHGMCWDNYHDGTLDYYMDELFEEE